MKVIVIGAGIVGANVAWRLAQKGADVTVVEAGRPGGGISGNSFAWVNSHRKPPQSYHSLNVLGMQAHRDLCREFPDQTWWGGRGCLEWSGVGQSAAEYEASIEALLGWGYSAEIIDRKRLAALAPDVDAGAFPGHQVAYFADEGWVSPIPMIHRLLGSARSRGASLLTMTGPARLLIEGGRARGVRTEAGTIEADAVVNCAGREVNSAIDDPALHLPMEPTLGLLAITPPVTAQCDMVMLGPDFDMRSDGAGRLMLHGTDIDHRLTPGITQAQRQAFGNELIARARKILPGMGEPAVEAVRLGTRARPEDGLPAVGALPGLAGYTVVATHSGVTLAPWLGHAVAAEVVDGVVQRELDDFRPGRFFGNAAPAARHWVQD